MKKETAFKELEKNIETTIYEGILKLGFNSDEALSIYYDLDLLNYLLQKDFAENTQCLDYLQEFIVYVNPRLNSINISLEKGRFKFTVPKEGIAYIYNENQNNNFLREIIQKVKTHNFTLDDVLTVFRHYSNEFVCEETSNSEFKTAILTNSNIASLLMKWEGITTDCWITAFIKLWKNKIILSHNDKFLCILIVLRWFLIS